jgi:hypothetical protein
MHPDFYARISESKKIATPYEAAMVDLQYAWKLPRQSWEELTTCRAAVEQAFEALPQDMKESVEVAYLLMKQEMELLSVVQGLIAVARKDASFFGEDRIDTASMVEQCGELISSARISLTEAVQLASTTAMEKHVAAELHYSLALQGIFDQLHIEGLGLHKQGKPFSCFFDLVLQYARMSFCRTPRPAEEWRQAVVNRAHAVRSIGLIRDVYGEEAESDFRMGFLKIIGAILGARTGEILIRDFAAEMRSLEKSMAPALEAGRYPLMKVWLSIWNSSVASLAVRLF